LAVSSTTSPTEAITSGPIALSTLARQNSKPSATADLTEKRA